MVRAAPLLLAESLIEQVCSGMTLVQSREG